MDNLKIAELILLAAAALISSAKSIIKFIGCIDKLMQKPKECTNG